ncbi:MAG: 6-phospho-beta-glucosidase [Treponema sp.]|jgi:6-phospho-beta-glucosidase|nr:6-phospho-beta-glucosidase [Treponema sp.]
MRKLKAAVIGAGSTYTPELIRGFIDKRDTLNFQSFYLMDIDKEKLDIVGGLAKRMLFSIGFKGEIVLTSDIDEAVKNADYIFAQIRVGRMEARIRDEKIPLKHGLLGQETTGAGGFMNALRTIPVMLDIAKRIEKLSPNSWLINFSNPSGIVAEALMNHSNVKMVGLCNCFVNMKAGIAENVGREDFDYEYLGLNHLSWITSVTVDGKNVLEKLGKSAGAKLKNIPDVDYDDELLEAVPALPSYYLSYFYSRDQQLNKCLKAEKTRGEICVGIEDALIEKYKNPDLKDKPKELEERGGALYSTAAIAVVVAIENDKNEYHVVGVKNNGAIPFMADDDVVEIKCMVNRNGVTPIPVKDPQNHFIKGLMQAVKAYEKLTVAAAVNGSRKDALAALMIHPLIGDFQKAKAVFDEMAAANADFLPKGLLP